MQIPETALEFNDHFNTDEKCLAFLSQLRWPRGFICPNCGHDDGYILNTRPVIQCPVCRHQTSVTAGTIFHKTRIPLRVWFYIIYSMSLDKGGASATRLAEQLGMYQITVWHIMHKIRHGMGRRDETITLAGFIEMDEAIIGPHARRTKASKSILIDSIPPEEKTKKAKKPEKPKQPGRGRPKKNGKNEKTQTPVLVLIEQEPSHAGVVAMKVLDAVARRDILEVVRQRVDECQHIKTDGLGPHHVLRSFNCSYEALICSGPAGCIELPCVHRAINLLKHFLMGTYFGVAVKHLQSYLHEFCFRFNRRDSSKPTWLSILTACVFGFSPTYAELTS